MNTQNTSSTDVPDNMMAHPQVQELVKQGEQSGQIAYEAINALLGDLQLDESAIETILEALERRDIEIVDDLPEAPAPAPQSTPTAKKTPSKKASQSTPAPAESTGSTPQPRSRHNDLDDVLSSLSGLE